MSGADISSLLYVKSNTFKMERNKIQTKKKETQMKRFSTCNILY